MPQLNPTMTTYILTAAGQTLVETINGDTHAGLPAGLIETINGIHPQTLTAINRISKGEDLEGIDGGALLGLEDRGFITT